jgi:methenyltetrahydromethanopterin cyclohydrolase
MCEAVVYVLNAVTSDFQRVHAALGVAPCMPVVISAQ